MKTEETVNRLLQVNSLAGVDIASTMPAASMAKTAPIKDITTWATVKQIMKALRNQGVTYARRRVRRHVFVADGLLLSTKVVISYKPNTERPDTVSLGI